MLQLGLWEPFSSLAEALRSFYRPGALKSHDDEEIFISPKLLSPSQDWYTCTYVAADMDGPKGVLWFRSGHPSDKKQPAKAA